MPRLDIMATKEVNLERLEFEIKKKLVLSVKELKGCKSGNCNATICPLCRFNNTQYGCYRNFCRKNQKKYETLMDQLPVFCKYEANGCQEILMKEDMAEHEAGCIYWAANCADLKCNTKAPSVVYMDHLAKVHKANNILVLENKLFNITTLAGSAPEGHKFAPTQINAFGYNFFEVGIIRNNFLFRWIYVLGNPDEAKNFYYHVKVKKGDTKEELNNFVQVRSMIENHQEITNAFHAFFVPMVRVKEFMDENFKIELEYKIRNMKEEAKDDEVESGISDDE